MSHDPQHPLYPVRFTKGNLAGTPAVLKILTKQQASLYQHLVSIENPHLEKIYEVGFQDDLFYSINEYVFRPDFYNYKLYDAYYKTNVKSLTLLEYIKNYEMFEKPSDSIHFIPERTALRLLLDLINGLEAMQASGEILS